MKVVGMKWGLVREAACIGTGFHPTGNPAGRVYRARFFFPVECSLPELGGHALETGGTTARIALESCKFLRLNVPWIFICWDFPLCFQNFCHLEETSFFFFFVVNFVIH